MSETPYQLQYKTRGNSSPQGKPRVYFCCHPNDFALYFDKISDEILTVQNCAVWYAKDLDAARDAEFLNDLAQMQLFVMPVTSDLLYMPNHAIDTEFSFAIKHHIPVLPLIQESNLEDVFNQKCGNMHFLDVNAQDATAIPYKEKLKSFLDSVLIGDDMAQKIRDAFDAYIFLSYRKKDRKYAKELMQLIHKNDFCRDIAIWYDEFLTPGENFNDAIKHALDKSDLFIMTVTPNLVSEQNYVMTIEYPMARKAGKHIIPAEMVKTDHDALHQKFEQLPAPTYARNHTELSQSLLKSIQALAIRENDASPEHNFFIGLAYLGGVDVEVDHERALALITSSAEAGLPQAITKLIKMYENGEGVERNYHKAVAWREKEISQAEKDYNNDRNEKTLDNLFWAVTECAEAYTKLGQASLAREKYKKAHSFLECSGFVETSNKLLRNLATSYYNLGDMNYGELNYYENRKICYQKALALLEQLHAASPSDKSLEDLARIYTSIGIPGLSGADAPTYREKAIAIAEELVQKSGSVNAKELLLHAYQYHGILLKISGKQNLPLAKSYYSKSLTLAEELYRETRTLREQRNLADCYGLVAGIHQEEGNMDAALELMEKSQEIREELAQKTQSITDFNNLAHAYVVMGTHYEKIGDNDLSLLFYGKAHVIRMELAKQTDSVQLMDDLARSWSTLADHYRTAEDLSTAFEYYNQQIAVEHKIAQKTQNPLKYDSLANTLCRVAGYYPIYKTAYLQKALEIYYILQEKHPEKRDYYTQRIKSIQSQLQS